MSSDKKDNLKVLSKLSTSSKLLLYGIVTTLIGIIVFWFSYPKALCVIGPCGHTIYGTIANFGMLAVPVGLFLTVIGVIRKLIEFFRRHKPHK